MRPNKPKTKSPHERIQEVIAALPRGKAISYGAVAIRAGISNGARQVAWVLRGQGDNLPWHRVINAQRGISLTGPNGERQRALLEHEVPRVGFDHRGRVLKEFMLD